ncbi:MAG: hypothetical protein IT437_14045 [Phycisphaerales bacterium]|nr:hypothetical protein [Phycisphaerales bacterium]
MNRVPAPALILFLAAPALAQIGSGHALDRNLQRGSGGMNRPGPSYADELRFRNAVVTGNAPGGFSFRGNVGYRAAGEFEARLGSDDLFAFRRDSIYSGLAGMGIRGTDALQYQFSLTTGTRPPSSLAGTGEFLRAGANRVADTGVPIPAVAPVDPAIRAAAHPQSESMLWELRSPAAYVSNRSMEPSLMGLVQDQQGNRVGLTASPLRGLSTVKIPKTSELAQELQDPNLARQDLGVSKPGEEVPRAVPEIGPKSATKSPYEQILADLQKRSEAREKELVPGRVVQGEAPPTPPGELPEWKARLDDLRHMLERGDTAKPDEKPDQTFLESLRSQQGRLRALAADGFDAYARHMKAGQEHLAAGRLFQAEERFTAALAIKAGDPMASIGRIHAQLGNSLFMSAAINLRKLFVAHPELIGVKYAPEILPSADRIGTIKIRLQELIQREAGMKRDAGLLLAYLGYQSDDAAAVAHGFEAMDSVEGEADPQLARLRDVLRQVWMAPAAPLGGTP